MYGSIKEHLKKELQATKDAGLYKEERIILSSQDVEIMLNTGEKVINFCANNYLGLSNNPEVIQAAKGTLDSHGFGMSSVRFICGTQDIHTLTMTWKIWKVNLLRPINSNFALKLLLQMVFSLWMELLLS
jgi:hypothetical protein